MTRTEIKTFSNNNTDVMLICDEHLLFGKQFEVVIYDFGRVRSHSLESFVDEAEAQKCYEKYVKKVSTETETKKTYSHMQQDKANAELEKLSEEEQRRLGDL